MEPYDLLFQGGMVGVFMIFTLVILRHVRDYMQKRDEDFRQERDDRAREWRDWIANRDAVFMDFLKDERTHRGESMTTGMSELNKVTEAIRDLATGMGEHDSRATVRHQEVMRRLESIKLGGGA